MMIIDAKDEHDDKLSQLLIVSTRKETVMLGVFNAHEGATRNDAIGPFRDNAERD